MISNRQFSRCFRAVSRPARRHFSAPRIPLRSRFFASVLVVIPSERSDERPVLALRITSAPRLQLPLPPLLLVVIPSERSDEGPLLALRIRSAPRLQFLCRCFTLSSRASAATSDPSSSLPLQGGGVSTPPKSRRAALPFRRPYRRAFLHPRRASNQRASAYRRVDRK
jgi:hypothetical protein